MRTCPNCQSTYPDETDICFGCGIPLAPPLSPAEVELAAGLARRYRIIRRLGAGGMGTVFLAEQIAVGNRPVALKVLLRKLLDDPEFLMRFQNEAASTGRIRHANVVTIYESGQSDDGTPYIAMEYLEGETLRQTLKSRGALSVQETAEILQQVGRGLNAAHKLGIVHRDLKPDNIFLTQSDESTLLVKVVDFGIAKLLDSANQTLTGVVLGTPAYMSAEQASGMRSDELDARSDIYSLGIVTYEMLTGQVPFHSDTPLGFVHKHVSEVPPPLLTLKSELAGLTDLQRVVTKALQKNPDERYESALEFANEFAEAARPSGLEEITVLVPRERTVEAMRAPGGPDAGDALSAAPVSNGANAAQAPSPISARERAEPLGKAATSTPPPLSAGLRPPAPDIRPPAARARSVAIPQRAARFRVLTPKTAIAIVGLIVAVGIGQNLWRRHSRESPTNMVYISGGIFTMGRDKGPDPAESPAHSVTVASFYLDRTPVTNAEYLEFVRAAGHAAPSGWALGSYPAGQDRWPVTGVSWKDAEAYADWKGKRLPTEAEWEFAARGVDGRLYPWGNNFDPRLTNSAETSLKHPEPVGSHPDGRSPSGVLDMSGNVWQWCLDAFQPYADSQKDSHIPVTAKVIRGGSFESDKDHVTATTRNMDLAVTQSGEIGFRCARTP